MDEREDIISKVRTYRDLVLKDFPMKVEKVYLFGSHAKGTPHKDSDIDVAFVVNRFEGDFFQVIPPIWKLKRQIDMRIEPHVIARESDYAGFLEEIRRTSIEI
ncbi:MAG: nucleotidyltransferase domain-containing protein [Prevotellaceae bacterium]|jgi:predicted nucleotidyltransferase|nr:nucleotidyltransferase domain-containing protein [Prevotellaceae bacterium]